MPECCNLLNLFADIVDIPMYDKEGMRETAKEKKKKSRGKGSAVIYFGSHTVVCYFTRGPWR